MNELTQNKLESYAHRILNDYDVKNHSALFKNKNIKISISDAYKIQSILTDLRIKRGEKVIGYKIGSISKQTQKKYGFSHPAWGRLWESELHSNGIKLNKENYSNPAMEAEFGITLNRNIDPKLVTPEYIFKSIESIYPLIEIHNLVFHGEAPHGSELLANNAIHAGIVLGPENKLPKSDQVTDLKLIYDKKIVDTWENKIWPKDMLSEIEWLVKEQSKINNILKKGNLILTGAYGFPVPINEKKIN